MSAAYEAVSVFTEAEYLLGLKCPYYRLYIPERGQRARSQYAGNAFHARMQQKVEALMLPIPALPRQRSVAARQSIIRNC